jgi:hypothetical protein
VGSRGASAAPRSPTQPARNPATSSVGAAPRAAVPVSNARAEASRRNGAKSRGPKTPEGKARSVQNALKHGLRAEKHVVLPDEDAAEFAALEAALLEELAPVGALQTVLARRVAVAAWRLARADRIEAELFEERRYADAGLGLALVRDGNGTRSFETLLRYRGAALAEFWRALRTLKALQAEARAHPLASAEAGIEAPAPSPVPMQLAAVAPASDPAPLDRPGARATMPNEPDSRGDPGLPSRPGDRANPGGAPCASELGSARISSEPRARPTSGAPTPCARPIEPRHE